MPSFQSLIGLQGQQLAYRVADEAAKKRRLKVFEALSVVQKRRSVSRYSVGSVRLHGAVMELWRMQGAQ